MHGIYIKRTTKNYPYDSTIEARNLQDHQNRNCSEIELFTNKKFDLSNQKQTDPDMLYRLSAVKERKGII